MIKKNICKKSLISVFEIGFLFFLFTGTLIYINLVPQPTNQDYKFTIESSLNSIYYNQNNRMVFMNEDLSTTTVNGDFSNISNYLDSIFLNYELIISNNSVSKTIFSCNSTSEKFYGEKIISIRDNTIFEFRKIRLGVCY